MNADMNRVLQLPTDQASMVCFSRLVPAPFAAACRVLVIALSLTASTAAMATITETVGGPGGGLYQISCTPGHFVAGFRAVAGAWVDGLGLVRVPFDTTSSKIGSARSREGWTSGKSGQPQEAYCGKGEALTGVTVTHTRGNSLPRQYVNSIGLKCQHSERDQACISSGELCDGVPPTVGGTIVKTVHDYKRDLLQCPKDEWATGVQGRSGKYVDAIALICEPLPESKEARRVKMLGKRIN
jgi:hypothetical protein